MDVLDHADLLKASHWDRKKVDLPAGELPDRLKALQKRHEAVDWKLFDRRWAHEAGNTAELDDAYGQRERLYRSSVLPMKRDTRELVAAAQRVARDKAAAKPLQDATKAIVGAAEALSKAIDDGLDELKAVHAGAQEALAKAQARSAEAKAKPASPLLDPKKLLQQLQLCKRDPKRQVFFGFIEARDKTPAVLALHPKVDGRKLFAKLQQLTGTRTGCHGTLQLEGSVLVLQPGKPLGGLLKKIRVPVKACGFRISNVVLQQAEAAA